MKRALWILAGVASICLVAVFLWRLRATVTNAVVIPAVVRWPVQALGAAPSRLEFEGRDRAAVVYRAPALTRAAITVPQKGVLQFAVGAAAPSPGAPLFEVTVSADVDGKSQELLRHSAPMILVPAPGPFQGQWIGHDVDLSRFGGQAVTLTIELRALSWPAAFQVPLAVPRIVGEATASIPKPPNIVLFAVDTLRADHLGVYGHKYPTSPNIDKLAADGAVFLRHYAQGGNTFISFPSLFTSRSPSHLGVGFDLTETPLGDDALTLTEILASHGYRTAAMIPDAYAGPALNLMQGFDEVRITRNLGNVKVFDLALDWLGQQKAEDPPFFLFVHVMEVHDPYGWQETPDAGRRFGGGEFIGPIPYNPIGRLVPPLFHSNLYLRRFYTDSHRYMTVPRPDELAFIKALYDVDIERTDAFIGRVAHMLETRDLADRTTVALVADHGEAFWEHDGIGAMHGVSVYDEIIRTPFILKGGAVTAGTRIVVPTANVDVLPTLLHAAGLPWQGIGEGTAVLATGNEAIANRMVTSQNRLHDYAAIQGDSKLVVDRYGRAKLFDLKTDPGEQHDLHDARSEQAASMTRELFERLDHRLGEEWTVAFSGPGGDACRFSATVTTTGQITWIDSLHFAGVNAPDSVRLAPARDRLEFTATSKEVDRSIMFEIMPKGADVSFDFSADARCARAFIGKEQTPLKFTTKNAGLIDPASFIPGTDAGVYVSRLPAWKPRQWTVLNLTQRQRTSAPGMLSPELRERLRSLGYIQ